jgi:hypothetical protein
VNGLVKITANGMRLGEVVDYGKINFNIKTKYDAKRKRE